MPYNPASPGAPSRGWEKAFLLLTGVLSATILLKIGQIQYLELLYALQMVLLLGVFARQGFEARVFRSMLVFASLYGAFTVLALGLAAASLGQDFYLPSDLSALHRPLILALLRAAELLASLSIMLWLVHVFARNEAKLRLLMRVYFWTGVVSCLYSLLTLPLEAAGLGTFGTYSHLRWRGFFNEGGPFGLYLISLLLVAMAMRALRWERRSVLWFAIVLFTISLLGSRSKAAAVALFLLLAVNVLLLQSGKRRLITLVVFLVAVGGLGASVDLGKALQLYRVGAETYERLSRLHAKDTNVVQGRVAGLFIVPRMIEQHPLVGVGWGNYGLVRNAPEYRGASAWAEFADEPALGVLGQASEFGLPLTLLLLVCLFFPPAYLRSIHAPGYVLNLALLQPFVHLFGAQLNMTYPWVVTAMALGLGLAAERRRSQSVQLRPASFAMAAGPEPAGAH